MDLVTINVRGTIFMTEASNIKNILLTSPLLNLNENSKYYNPKRQEYFFDRNAAVFESVLGYFVTNKLHVPTNVCAELIKEELEFWGVPAYHVRKCCWKAFFQSTDDMTTLKSLLSYVPCIQSRDRCCSWVKISQKTMDASIKSRTWEFLHNYNSSLSAKVFHYAICFTILLSIVLLLIQSVPTFREDNGKSLNVNLTSEKLHTYWNTRPNVVIIYLEAITNGILTLEWLLRFFTCPSKKAFMKRFLNVTDLTAWIGTWLCFSVVVNQELFFLEEKKMAAFYPFYVLDATRGFRVFRLIADNCGVKILLLSVKSSVRELCILLMSFSCAAIVFGVLLYTVQLKSDSPFSPPNALFAIWWSVITMTTVGYGDYYPTDVLGYLIGILCSITGILLIALPVAVTSANFNDFYNFNKYRAYYQETLDKEKENRTDEITTS